MSDDALKWRRIASEPGPELPLFQVRFDRMRHPRSEADFTRVVLEAPDWVTIVAITKDGDIVMVEQYRFGVEDLTLEPVGGIVDEGEESIEAAKRELLEETGFGEGQWRSLGVVQANPAIHNNLCHLWCATGVRRIQDQQLDSGEAIKVHLMSIDEVRNAIADGRFLHPLGQAAMSRVYKLWESDQQWGHR